MLMEQYAVGKCPECDKSTDIDLLNYNVEVGQTCPHCNAKLRIEYYDMKNNAIIIVPHTFSQEELYVIDGVFSLGMFDDFIKRIVRNVQKLREKIEIINAGLDDKVIEIVKLMAFVQVENIDPDFEVKNCFFEVRNDEKSICFYNEQGDCIVTKYNETGYQNTEAALRKVLNEDTKAKFEIIDSNWARGMIKVLYEAHPQNSSKSVVNSVNRQKYKVEDKTRFCKMCGGKIDNEARKCVGCGKQYFKGIKFNKLTITLLIVLLLLLINKDYIISRYIYSASITREEINLEINDVYELSCVANFDIVYDEIEWESSDSSVVSVSNSGRIVARNEGSAQIDILINDIVKDSCIVNVSLNPVYVRNGELIVSPQRHGLPEITVNAPQSSNCYVYLKNINNSKNSVAFYVKSGSSATVNAPAGTYELYYATGETWYGEKYKFGKGTNFYKSNSNTVLSENSRSYDVVEFTLYAVPNGNMHTKNIDETEFPD